MAMNNDMGKQVAINHSFVGGKKRKGKEEVTSRLAFASLVYSMML
jgi:hypothetical protein